MNIKKLLLSCLLILVSGIAALFVIDFFGNEKGENSDEPPANELTDIPALMAYFDVPGVSIAIIKDFKIEQLLVYGVKDADTREPVSEETIFQAASISKPLTALAVMKLVQQGAVDLDEDIHHKLISWQIPENSITAQGEVTWRRLLNHTAGISANEYNGYETTAALPSLVQILNGEPPANSEPVVVDQTPGGEFNYSNGGYVILQQALIDVAQQPFQQIISETVFDPLGMTHSTFAQPLPQESIAKASSGHGADGHVMSGRYHIFPELAPAGLWTAPKDLALLLIELQLSLRGQSNKVLDEHLVEEMIPSIEGGGYGLGFRIWPQGDEIYFGHDGINPGFVSIMIAHRSSGDGAVVMINSDNGNGPIKRILKIIGITENWPGY